MTVLLIDNHDSFSAILRDYLWQLTGERPLFVRNDGLTRDELEALDFDAAVLSPGPGHPANVRDFGICRDLLELFPHRPVLGVCLGMQGMAHFAGATVAPLSGALHGRPGRIVHDGSALYAGIPRAFTAVRYHSLVVREDSLPPGVTVTARSEEDGQVMGVSFEGRPWFGVQFHPESVGTEHGKTLLGNFLGVAGLGRPSSTRDAGDTPGSGKPAETPHLIPHRELSWRDPAETFVRFLRDASASFWLDACASRADSGWATTAMGCGEVLSGSDASASLRAIVRELRETRTAPWQGYRGGPVGQFDYEWNPEIPSSTSLQGRWMLPEGWLVFDAAARKVYAAWEGSAPPAWLGAAMASWEAPDAATLPEASLPPFAAWKPLLGEAEHAACVGSLKDAITRGETYEACLTHAWSAHADADPLGVFLKLRSHNPAPYAAYFAFPDVNILSASPELFLEGTPDRMLRSRPIKGTRRRGADAASDRALRDDLAHSEKDAAENRMITDLTRNDLARVCLPGSVEVPAFLHVEEHPAVFQLVSEVRGRMAPGMDAWDALAASFPGGSMTGAPKERTMELLRGLEVASRGVYSGALGYFTNGAFVLSMVIRTLEHADGAWRTGCGGAILADSDAAAEWRESVVKARSVIDAVTA